MSARRIWLGHGVSARFVAWAPDRDLNPQHRDRPDINPCGLIIDHGDGCTSAIMFDLPGMSEIFPGRDLWQVISLDPQQLHVEPSILRAGVNNGTDHNHHGFIRGGYWEPCGDDRQRVT